MSFSKRGPIRVEAWGMSASAPPPTPAPPSPHIRKFIPPHSSNWLWFLPQITSNKITWFNICVEKLRPFQEILAHPNICLIVHVHRKPLNMKWVMQGKGMWLFYSSSTHWIRTMKLYLLLLRPVIILLTFRDTGDQIFDFPKQQTLYGLIFKAIKILCNYWQIYAHLSQKYQYKLAVICLCLGPTVK